MKIIAHRGFWEELSERNTIIAFTRAVSHEFGIETDFRDYDKQLKISHDMAVKESMEAADCFKLFKSRELPLAINIKADGLQEKILELLEQYDIKNYFCFDMSLPDTMGYIDKKICFFVRESEYEPVSGLYENAEGVWMDGFNGDEWITWEKISRHLKNGKKVCIVSPELHKRDYKAQWMRYRTKEFMENPNIYLCTDFPGKAREFFNE